MILQQSSTVNTKESSTYSQATTPAVWVLDRVGVREEPDYHVLETTEAVLKFPISASEISRIRGGSRTPASRARCSPHGIQLACLSDFKFPRTRPKGLILSRFLEFESHISTMSETKKKTSSPVHLVAGGTAGLCEALACHPLDTIKVRMQLSTRARLPGVRFISIAFGS